MTGYALDCSAKTLAVKLAFGAITALAFLLIRLGCVHAALMRSRLGELEHDIIARLQRADDETRKARR